MVTEEAAADGEPDVRSLFGAYLADQGTRRSTIARTAALFDRLLDAVETERDPQLDDTALREPDERRT